MSLGTIAKIVLTGLLAALFLAGCSSNTSVYGSVSYGYGYGYYDPWYRHDVIVRPPPVRPERPPARPEHPIARPPPMRPTPLPARPMPRPAPQVRMR
jgi:hypothetical protein